MIPGQICDLKLGEDYRQLDLHGSHLFPCVCFNVDVTRNVGREVPWHWHQEVEVIAIVEGRGLVRGGGESWLLEEGEGAFFNANTLHSVQLVDGGFCRLHSLVFSADLLAGVPGSVFEQRYLRPLLQSSCQAVALRQDQRWQKEGVAALESAYQAYAGEKFGWELQVRSELSRLWYLVAEHTSPTERRAEDAADTARLKIMLGYIHANYDQPVSLDQIAAAANVSKRECLRCFQRTIGVAPIQYLQRFRIREASTLLGETELPITEVGGRCGFESPSYFSLLFRRHTGQTPKEYRRELRTQRPPLASLSSLGYTDTEQN